MPPFPSLVDACRPTWRFTLTLAASVAYLALHLPFLAWSPDDIDSTNFMLALRDYDLREHQPHPPGYPVFIGMAKAVRSVLSAVGPIAGPATPETLDVNALAFCSAFFGALAAWPLMALWTNLGASTRRAFLATILTMASPLFWYSGIRPLSDLPGLTVALCSLALLARCTIDTLSPGRRWRLLLVAGTLSGLAAGIRIQTLWLTSAAIAASLAVMLWRREPRATGALVAGFAAGVLAWAIPLTLVVGGWRVYLDVLTAQASDDFRGAIFAVDLSLRTLGVGVYDTLVLPWGSLPLAGAVLILAAAGAARLVVIQPRGAAALGIIFIPYLLLHLIFQETAHTRYALPLICAVSYLAVCGLTLMSHLKAPLALALVVVAVSTTMGPVMAQARSGSPAMRALKQMREALEEGTARPVIAMHHAVKQQLRFASFDEATLPAPVRYEWLSVVDYFRSGGDAPVWFLASQRRSDLALFDPAAKRALHQYEWSFEPEAVLGGARPRAVTWYEISRPGWMAGEGWALTPETRGVADRSRRGPSGGATVAYIARRPAAAVLMIGGRNLGGPCRTAARLEATIDGRPIAEWTLPAGEPFLQFVDLPSGALEGTGGFAELRLVASDLSGAGLGVDVSLEQFDVQSGGRPVSGFGAGWHEPELTPATGEQWRWAGQRAVVQIRNFGRDVTLEVRADDPTRTLGHAVELQVRAAGRVVARQRFEAAVDWRVPIPAALIAEARGRVTIMSDSSFVPDVTQGNGDRRDLALRVLELALEFDDRPPQEATPEVVRSVRQH